jgi:hypothetical protein
MVCMKVLTDASYSYTEKASATSWAMYLVLALIICVR